MKESRRRGETVWCFLDKVTVRWPFWKPQLQHMSTLISTKQCTLFPFNCNNGLHTRFHVFLLSPLSLWISGIICPLSVLFLTLMIHFCGPMLLQKHVLTKCLYGYLIKILFQQKRFNSDHRMCMHPTGSVRLGLYHQLRTWIGNAYLGKTVSYHGEGMLQTVCD